MANTSRRNKLEDQPEDDTPLKPINFDGLDKYAKKVEDEHVAGLPKCDICGKHFEKVLSYPFVAADLLDVKKETSRSGQQTTIRTTTTYDKIEHLSLDFCPECLLSQKRQYFFKVIFRVSLVLMILMLFIPILDFFNNLGLLSLEREFGTADPARVAQLSHGLAFDIIWAVGVPLLFAVIMRLWYVRIHTLDLSRQRKGLVNWIEFMMGNHFRYSGLFGFVYVVLGPLARSKASQKDHHDSIFTLPDYEYICQREKSIRPL